MSFLCPTVLFFSRCTCRTLAGVVQPDGGVLLPLACLHPLGAAITFANAFSSLPQNGEGLTWSALGDPVQTVGSLTIGGVLLLLALDAVLYGVLTWYLDKVRCSPVVVCGRLLSPALVVGWFADDPCPFCRSFPLA